MSKRTDDFLNSLLNTGKVFYTDQGRREQLNKENSAQNPFYKALRNGYSKLQRPPTIPSHRTHLDLADFIIDRLAKLEEYSPNPVTRYDPGTLSAINYSTTPNEGYGNYEPGLSAINLHPTHSRMNEENPILTLLHEGTHGLDHLFMRTYQLPAIASLARTERSATESTPFSLSDILGGTKSILNNPVFNEGPYSYDGFFRPNIYGGFRQLSDPPPAPPISDFYGARNKLSELSRQSLDLSRQDRVPRIMPDPFGSLSELAAFGTESLPHVWNVNAHTNPAVADLMHSMMGAQYDKFKDLRLNPHDHPRITRAFDDRLEQLRGAMQRGAPAPTTSGGMGQQQPQSGAAAGAAGGRQTNY